MDADLVVRRIVLFEYEERGTPKAYRILRALAVQEDRLEELEILWRQRFGEIPPLE